MNQILSGSTWYKTNRHKHKLYRAFKLYVLSEYKKFLVFFRTEKKNLSSSVFYSDNLSCESSLI